MSESESAADPRGERSPSTIACALLGGVTVAFVIALVVAAMPTVRAIVRRTQARASGNDIALASAGYHSEYGRYPTISPYADVVRSSDPALMAALEGTNPAGNPRGIRFIEPRTATGIPPANGVVRDPGSPIDGTYVDPWGAPFTVVLDTDLDGNLRNPEPGATPAVLHHGVLVFSSGPDGDPTTWSDNIVSW